jgi:hypothetical protein
MKYQITKQQYSKLVYKLIDVFFKNAEFTLTEDEYEGYVSYDITVGGEEVAWVTPKQSSYTSKGCEHELVIYDTTISKITNFIPIFKKKVFSKILTKYFSDIIGVDIDCIYFDYRGEDIIYRKKLKKKK